MTRINFLIVHYNTPLLTKCLIRSIQKYSPQSNIFIFDNSDREPFNFNHDDDLPVIEVIDNTDGKIIDFERFFKRYPNKSTQDGGRCISARHCLSVDVCMDIINDNFILLDSDVLLTRDASLIWNEDYIFVGEIQKQDYVDIVRLLPYFCYINVRMCQALGLRFFNEDYMHGLNVNNSNGYYYDTGAYFYQVAHKYPHQEIRIKEFVKHYKGGSWDYFHSSNTKEHGLLTPKEWLQFNHSLWE